MTIQTESVQLFTGATVNGVQTQAEVLMQRHTPKDWPTAAQALAQWSKHVDALNAKDFEMPLQDLAMNPTTGGLFNRAKNPMGSTGVIPTRTALQHFVGFNKDGPSHNVENLEYYSPAIRAQMFAEQQAKMGQRSIVLRTAAKGTIQGPDGQVTEDRVIRAFTSSLHSKEYGDDKALIAQCNRLPQEVLANARMRVVKEWDYTHVEMVLPNKVREVKKGVVINARINLKNSETKGGSFESSVGTMNLVCLNGMVGQGAGSTVTIKHVGDIRTRMIAGVKTVIELVDVYLDEYFEAYQQVLPMTQSDAIQATVRRYKLPEATGHALGTLWNVDGELGGGHTVAGLANAMTRYAQSLPVERALDIEAAAGKVVALGLDAFI